MSQEIQWLLGIAMAGRVFVGGDLVLLSFVSRAAPFSVIEVSVS